jgi:hypothetical protein
MKSVFEPIDERLDKLVHFKMAVTKKCTVIYNIENEIKQMFKKFEKENQPLIPALPVFLESEKENIKFK